MELNLLLNILLIKYSTKNELQIKKNKYSLIL